MPAAKIIKVYMKVRPRRIRQKDITTILIFRPTDLLSIFYAYIFFDPPTSFLFVLPA